MTEPKPIEAFPAQAVHDEGASGATIRWVISEVDGSDNYSLRVIELAAGGNTPHHSHWFEHQNYVVEGEGTVTIGDTVYPVKAGDVIFVPGDVRASVPQQPAQPRSSFCAASPSRGSRRRRNWLGQAHSADLRGAADRPSGLG